VSLERENKKNEKNANFNKKSQKKKSSLIEKKTKHYDVVM
jgi:hypothetical protein